MPLRQKPSLQMITKTRADQIVHKLKSLQIPVDDVCEIGPSGLVSVTDPDYEDDNAPHQFVANVWGVPGTELGLLDITLKTGGVDAVLQLAQEQFAAKDPSNAFHTEAAALSAVLYLPAVFEVANKVLTCPA